MLRRIAGKNRRIERADRNAAKPIGKNAGFVEALIDAGLIGTERAPALQNERNALVVRHDDAGAFIRLLLTSALAALCYGGVGARVFYLALRHHWLLIAYTSRG